MEYMVDLYDPANYGAAIKISNRVLLAMSSSSRFDDRILKTDLTRVTGYAVLSDRYPEYHLASDFDRLHDAHSALSDTQMAIASAIFANAPIDALEAKVSKLHAAITELNNRIETALISIKEQESKRAVRQRIMALSRIEAMIHKKIRAFRESDLLPCLGQMLSKTDIQLYMILKFLGEETPLDFKYIHAFWLQKDRDITIQALRQSLKKLEKHGYLSVVKDPGVYVGDRATSYVDFNDSDMYSSASEGGLGYTALTPVHLGAIMACDRTDTLRLLLRVLYEVSLDIYDKRYNYVSGTGAAEVYSFDITDAMRKVHLSHARSIKAIIADLERVGIGTPTMQIRPTRWDAGRFSISMKKDQLPSVNEFRANIFDPPEVAQAVDNVINEVAAANETHSVQYVNGIENVERNLAYRSKNGKLLLPNDQCISLQSAVEAIYMTVGTSYLQESLLLLFHHYGRDLQTLNEQYAAVGAVSLLVRNHQPVPKHLNDQRRVYDTMRKGFDDLCGKLVMIAKRCKATQIRSNARLVSVPHSGVIA